MSQDIDTISKFRILGGEPLRGVVRLTGAKNAALPIIVAAILANEDVILTNVPLHLKDVEVTFEIIRAIGGEVRIEGNRLIINGKGVNMFPPSDLCSKIRSSLVFLGALLAKLGSENMIFICKDCVNWGPKCCARKIP